MQETTETIHLASTVILPGEATTHATTEHVGPHIPSSKGEIISEWTVAGFPITNTIFSTWIFMAVFFVLVAVFYTAIRTRALPHVRALGLDVVNRIFDYVTSLLGSAQMARRYVWLLGGIMVIIFTGNIFGLILDWLVLISANNWLAVYFRPMYSDLSTTLVFSLTVIIVAQITAIAMKGPVYHFSHYFWNYHGDSTAEKIVGVFVGWLHFAGEFIRIGSLSMRLFLNIFVGAILISVVVFVGTQIPAFHTGAFRILALPFWFFELLVAFLQAYIFMTLSALYIRESIPESYQH
ncbi:F0F1 ATP synthase subunit A [Candidatus Gracilibacteria bacterium]|nr:F0F1 ATP synthase subunit A [Candidatus Gracilibacteria bacterium]